MVLEAGGYGLFDNLCSIDPLLDKDLETNNEKTAVAM
jgi:hypothetical protein